MEFIASHASRAALKLAVGLGFEPRLMGPKPIVLPLDDPTIFSFQ